MAAYVPIGGRCNSAAFSTKVFRPPSLRSALTSRLQRQAEEPNYEDSSAP